MALKEALLAVISGGGGWLAYLLMEHVSFLKQLRPDLKRYASLALSGLLPVLAWLVLLGMGYEAVPATWQGWVEKAFALAAGALVVGQGIHGAVKLKPRPDNPQGL